MKVNFMIAATMLCVVESVAQEVVPDSTVIRDLQEVVVDAKSAYTSAVKSTYIPTSRQKNTSQNLAELLQNMMVPTLQVSGNSVSTSEGMPVALFIDWLPASPPEIDALNTRDVLRVEVLDFPDDPRFRNESHVVNIIMRRYDYGGYVRLYSDNTFNDFYRGTQSIYGKYTRGKTVFDVNAYNQMRNDAHSGTSETGYFKFPSGLIERNRITSSSKYESENPSVSARAIYATEKMQLTHYLDFAYTSTPHDDMSGLLYYRPEAFDCETYNRLSDRTAMEPRLSLDYYFSLPKKWALEVVTSVSYLHNEINRDYSSGINIANNMEENGWTWVGDLYSQKQFGVHGLQLGLSGMYSNTRLNYSGDTDYNERLRMFLLGPTLFYSYTKDKFYGRIGGGAIYYDNRVGDASDRKCMPYGYFSLQYAFSEKYSLRFQGITKIQCIDASMLNPAVVRENELMYYSGNENLKAYNVGLCAVNYTWLMSNAFSASAYMQYYLENNHTVDSYLLFDHDKAILRRPENDGNYHKAALGMSFSLKTFGNRLHFSTAPQLAYQNVEGRYSAENTMFMINLDVSYYLGNFYVRGHYNNGFRGYSGTYSYRRESDNYWLKAGWGDNHWNIGLAVANPFRKSMLGCVTRLDTDYYGFNEKTYDPTKGMNFLLTASYTFNYGKKVGRNDEINEASTSSGAIR